MCIVDATFYAMVWLSMEKGEPFITNHSYARNWESGCLQHPQWCCTCTSVILKLQQIERLQWQLTKTQVITKSLKLIWHLQITATFPANVPRDANMLNIGFSTSTQFSHRTWKKAKGAWSQAVNEFAEHILELLPLNFTQRQRCQETRFSRIYYCSAA